MKKFILIFLSLLLTQVDLYASVEVQSKIESVVVYSDSAYVKRTGVGTVKKGENIFNFTGLPAGLIDNSVMVGIKSGNGKILDVKIEKTYLTKQYQDKVKFIKEKIDKLDQEIKLLNAEVSAINNYIEFLRKLSPFSTGVKLLQNEFEGYAKFIENGIRNGYKNLAEIEIKLNKLREDKTNLENELANLGKQREEAKNVIVTLQGQKEGDVVEIEISYLVENTTWNPQYDLYVDTLKNTINFDVYAKIIQNTGEDWKDVRIEISTSKPLSGKLEELKPWYLDIYRPREPVVFRTMAVPKALALEKEEKETLEEEIEKPMPVSREEATSFSFILKDTVSIPSDNQPHRIFLTSKVISKDGQEESILDYQTIPKVSPYVYLIGNFKNPFDFPILAGKMNIYLDGRFVSTEQLSKTYSSGEDISISLGIDESIKVERKRIKKFTEYSGIVSKTEKIIYEYEIIVKNGKSRALSLTVKDNYPVSLNEQIKVQLEKPKEKEAEITKDGIVVWKFNLDQKSNKKVLLKFTIEYPKGTIITGID